MTTRPEFERNVADWLNGAAGDGTPDYLEGIEMRVAGTRQRAWWSSPERWLPVDLTTRANALTSPRIGRPLLVGLLLVALLVTVVLVAIGTRRIPPPPFGLARNGSVITWQHGDIFRADSEQAVPKPIIAGPTDDIAPLPSRDGTKLAFLRRLFEHTTDLMLANIDGTNIRPILAQPLTDMDWYEWSAKDDRLATVSSIGGHRTLSIVDVGHGSATPIDVGDLEVVNDVYWLPPSGESLVFTASPHPDQGDFAIYTVRADGTDLTRISLVLGDQASYLDLQVAPDGRTLSYWNYELSGATKASQTHLRDLATDQDRVVTFDPTNPGGVMSTAQGETALVFSPDSRHAVLQREDGVGAQFLIASLDGSSPNLLIGPKFDWDSTPAYGFSPDGARVFVAFANEKPVFYDVATGTATTAPETIENWGGYQRLAP
jgi:hypothetical protein